MSTEPPISDLVSDVRLHITPDLLKNSVLLTRLLHAADTFPHGGLYSGRYAILAVLRYLHLWLPLLHTDCTLPKGITLEMLVPPLDIALVWLVHRLDNKAYHQDCKARFGHVYHPSSVQAFAFTDGGSSDKEHGLRMCRVWQAVFGPKANPGNKAKLKLPQAANYPMWPPHTGENPSLATSLPQVKLQPGTSLATTPDALYKALNRQASFLHHALRACYLEQPFLQQALTRYCRFLALAKRTEGQQPHPLVPTFDIDLMWHTHLATSGEYDADTRALLGHPFSHNDNVKDIASGSAFLATKDMYEQAFRLLYDPPATQLLPLDVPHPVSVHMTVLAHYMANRSDAPTAQAVQATLGKAVPQEGASDTRPYPADVEVVHSRLSRAYHWATLSASKRCGGHAMYLLSLADAALDTWFHSLRGCCLPADNPHRVTAKAISATACQFQDFRNLPHYSGHPYLVNMITMRQKPLYPGALVTDIDVPVVCTLQPSSSLLSTTTPTAIAIATAAHGSMSSSTLRLTSSGGIGSYGVRLLASASTLPLPLPQQQSQPLVAVTSMSAPRTSSSDRLQPSVSFEHQASSSGVRQREVAQGGPTVSWRPLPPPRASITSQGQPQPIAEARESPGDMRLVVQAAATRTGPGGQLRSQLSAPQPGSGPVSGQQQQQQQQQQQKKQLQAQACTPFGTAQQQNTQPLTTRASSGQQQQLQVQVSTTRTTSGPLSRRTSTSTPSGALAPLQHQRTSAPASASGRSSSGLLWVQGSGNFTGGGGGGGLFSAFSMRSSASGSISGRKDQAELTPAHAHAPHPPVQPVIPYPYTPPDFYYLTGLQCGPASSAKPSLQDVAFRRGYVQSLTLAFKKAAHDPVLGAMALAVSMPLGLMLLSDTWWFTIQEKYEDYLGKMCSTAHHTRP